MALTRPLSNTKFINDANLVSYWKLDGNSNDSKGSNNGADTSMSYSTDNFGQVGVFNGSTGKIDLGTGLNSTLISNAWSISLWVKPTGVSTLQFFMACDNSSGVRQFAFGVNTDAKLYFSRDNIQSLKNVGNTLTAGVWQHLVVTYNGTTLLTYLQGVLNTSISLSALGTSANSLYLGQRQYSGSEQPYTGSEDDCAIFSRILSYAEVNEIYQSTKPIPVTVGGNAQIDTAQSVFGGASGLFDGTGDFLSVPPSDDFYFDTGDLTIDFRARLTTIANYAALYDHEYVNYQNKIEFSFDPSGGGRLACNVLVGGSMLLDFYVPFTASINTWYHVEIGRSSGVWHIFIDGIEQTKTLNSGNYALSLPNIGAYLRIGDEIAVGSGMTGWLDEYRVSKGICRHNSNFTPPSSAYTPDSYTVLLLHMDGTDGSTTFIGNSFSSSTLSDTITDTDTIIKVKTSSKILSESLAMVASLIKLTSYLLTEIVTSTATLLKQANRIFIETITHTATFLGIKVTSKSLTENISITDIPLGRIIQRLFSEVTSLTASFIKISNRILSEITNLTDTFVKTMLYCKTLIENISITDQINRVIQHLFNEITTITATFSSSKLWTAIYTETITTTDSIIKLWNRILSETITIVSEIIIRLNGVVTNLWSKIARTIDSWNKTPRN